MFHVHVLVTIRSKIRRTFFLQTESKCNSFHEAGILVGILISFRPSSILVASLLAFFPLSVTSVGKIFSVIIICYSNFVHDNKISFFLFSC